MKTVVNLLTLLVTLFAIQASAWACPAVGHYMLSTKDQIPTAFVDSYTGEITPLNGYMVRMVGYFWSEDYEGVALENEFMCTTVDPENLDDEITDDECNQYFYDYDMTGIFKMPETITKLDTKGDIFVAVARIGMSEDDFMASLTAILHNGSYENDTVQLYSVEKINMFKDQPMLGDEASEINGMCENILFPDFRI